MTTQQTATQTAPTPFFDAYETSLSGLDNHDWQILSNTWARGIDWCVRKLGKKWVVSEQFCKSSPMFKTKIAAFEYVSNLVRAEGRWRAYQSYKAEAV